MMKHSIVTIGRQFGSGGHEVGNRLAERLNIPLYDHNLIRMAAEEMKLSPEEAQKLDERGKGRFLSAYAAGSIEYRAFIKSDEAGVPLSDKMYETQSAIIRRLADQGPGIFVGRCADYVLGDYSNVINAFIYAYREDRVRRIMKLYQLDEKKALDAIKKTDRERRHYYEVRTGRDWGSIEAHGMLFNVSLLGIDGAVDALEAIYRKWEERSDKA